MSRDSGDWQRIGPLRTAVIAIESLELVLQTVGLGNNAYVCRTQSPQKTGIHSDLDSNSQHR